MMQLTAIVVIGLIFAFLVIEASGSVYNRWLDLRDNISTNSIWRTIVQTAWCSILTIGIIVLLTLITGTVLKVMILL
jgi:hypothetical protein